MVKDESLRQHYGALFALMESTPGRPTLPAPGPAEIASVAGLLAELRAMHRPLAFMLEVRSGVLL
jgi:hypothetical protein